jgi:hypothetical protein
MKDGLRQVVSTVAVKAVGVAVVVLLTVVATVVPAHPAAAQTPVNASVAVPAVNLAVDGVSPGVRDSITRLYLAVFSRDPDLDGRRYWVDVYVNGTSLPEIAAAFMSSTEWQQRIGTLNDNDFVTLLYHNVLQREPDPDGMRYWLGQAAAGLARTDMLLWFSEGEEFVRRTGTAAPEPPPFPALPPNSGTGRRIVYANQAQRVWLVEADGTLRDSYAVSGRRNVPSPGTYHVYSKSERTWAGHGGITMNHMVRFAWGTRLSIGFHSIPRYGNGTPMQTEDQLGTFQSAGCVRQADGKAEALYHWSQVGDTVVVVE